MLYVISVVNVLADILKIKAFFVKPKVTEPLVESPTYTPHIGIDDVQKK